MPVTRKEEARLERVKQKREHREKSRKAVVPSAVRMEHGDDGAKSGYGADGHILWRGMIPKRSHRQQGSDGNPWRYSTGDGFGAMLPRPTPL